MSLTRTLFPPHGIVRGYVALANRTQYICIVVGPELLLVDDLAHQVLFGEGRRLRTSMSVEDAEEGKLQVAFVLGLLIGDGEKVLHVLPAALA